ncbi:MAG: hypothetical protein JO055_11240 [Alphaproteobacteria bacterium]|nr:hypothetical protein [Alphaproteobacteria bacterium]
MIRTLVVSSIAAALLAACGPVETRTVYYDAPRPAAYTSGYYVAPVVTVREPRYYNYYSPGYYDSYGVWRTERATY